MAIPFGNNQRYDLVVDTGKKLVRVQVKTGKLKNGCVVFRSCSSNGFTHEHKGYRGQIDAFAVYCPQNECVYLVPVEAVGAGTTHLRLDKPICRQKCNVRWAKDFVLLRSGVEQPVSSSGS